MPEEKEVSSMNSGSRAGKVQRGLFQYGHMLLKGWIWIKLLEFMAFSPVVISLQDNWDQMAKAYNIKHKRQKPTSVIWLCQE